MSVIDFRQVAAPSFGDTNNLIELAMRQSNAGIEGLQKTWETAMGAVKNKNQADMIGVLNQQSTADLDNPQTVQALMEQFKTMAAPTGGNFDPMVMQAAIDGRGDTLRAREGVKLDNAMGNVNLQQGVENYSNSVVTNKNTLADYERGIKADQYQNNIKKSADITAGYQAYIGSLDPNADAEAIAQLTAKRDEALQGVWGGEIPLDAFGGINAINEKNALAKRALVANIEGKEVGTDLAIKTADLNEAKFGLQVEQAGYSKTEKEAKLRNERATMAGLAPNTYNSDNTINGGSLAQQLTTKIDTAQRMANAPPNSIPFSTRINEDIKSRGKEGGMPESKLRQMQKTLNNYKYQSKDGKSLALTDDQKWRVYEGLMSGEIQSSKYSVGQFAGLSNYEGLFEEVIPKYMDSYINVEMPANNQKIAAEQVDALLTSVVNSGGDKFEAVKAMNITPGSEYFMYLPESMRKKLDPKGTDKRRYTDVPAAKQIAKEMEENVKKKNPPKQSKKLPTYMSSNPGIMGKF